MARLDVATALLDQYKHSKNRASILEALESISFPPSSRKNVRREGAQAEILGMCLGMTECYFKGPVPSRQTRTRPNLCRLLCELARQELPSFRFTSIQVNKDYAAELHVDKKDAGDSRIIGLGSYVGGQLWVDDASHGQRGRVADIRGRWLGFDGNLPHKVLPFKGRRYTLVYFSKIRGWSVGQDPQSPNAKLLFHLGFPLPSSPPRMQELLRGEERLKRARRRFEAFCAQTLERGGAGRRVKIALALQGHAQDVRCEASSATEVGAITAALPHPEGWELSLGSLALLPSDRLARLALPKHVLCNGCKVRRRSTPAPVTPKRRRVSHPALGEGTPPPVRRPVARDGTCKPKTKHEDPSDSDEQPLGMLLRTRSMPTKGTPL